MSSDLYSEPIRRKTTGGSTSRGERNVALGAGFVAIAVLVAIGVIPVRIPALLAGVLIGASLLLSVWISKRLEALPDRSRTGGPGRTYVAIAAGIVALAVVAAVVAFKPTIPVWLAGVLIGAALLLSILTSKWLSHPTG